MMPKCKRPRLFERDRLRPIGFQAEIGQDPTYAYRI